MAASNLISDNPLPMVCDIFWNMGVSYKKFSSHLKGNIHIHQNLLQEVFLVAFFNHSI